jgi:hypothetical protein
VSDKKLIWTDRAREVVRRNWGRFGAELIRGMVIHHQQMEVGLYSRGSASFHAPYAIPTIGGIIYQAWKMNLIDDEERINLIKAHKRKSMSIKTKEAILERDNFLCKKCGEYDNLTVDHIIAVAMGGRDNPENLQTLCKSCNRTKSVNHR